MTLGEGALARKKPAQAWPEDTILRAHRAVPAWSIQSVTPGCSLREVPHWGGFTGPWGSHSLKIHCLQPFPTGKTDHTSYLLEFWKCPVSHRPAATRCGKGWVKRGKSSVLSQVLKRPVFTADPQTPSACTWQVQHSLTILAEINYLVNYYKTAIF